MSPNVEVLHQAGVARIPAADAESKSAVLVARSLGYLTVRVLFHGRPVAALDVQFGLLGSPSASDEPTTLEPSLTTDEDGKAVFPRLVTSGFYACQIERQPRAVVHTAHSLDEPHVLVLPVGRPFVDITDIDEFAVDSSDASD
jgi:hypothetical protein